MNMTSCVMGSGQKIRQLRTRFAVVEAAVLKPGAVEEGPVFIVLVAVARVQDPISAVNLAYAREVHQVLEHIRCWMH